MANQAERRRWNDGAWTSCWLEREVLTAFITPVLLDHATLRPGERVLDVGSGGGRTTIEAAGAVAPLGSVVGIDLSETLVALARRRAIEEGTGNATFVVGDAQTDTVAGRPFDVAMSQFGVMFFDDPVSAFANVRDHLRPGGRCVFACWQPIQRNPWHTAAVLRPFLAPAAPWHGPCNPPGPFSLGERADTDSILSDAGFIRIGRNDVEVTVAAPQTAIWSPLQLEYLGVAPSDMPGAESAVEDHLARFDYHNGEYRLPLAYSICSAVNRP